MDEVKNNNFTPIHAISNGECICSGCGKKVPHGESVYYPPKCVGCADGPKQPCKKCGGSKEIRKEIGENLTDYIGAKVPCPDCKPQPAVLVDYTEIRDDRVRAVICNLMSEMLDNSDEHDIYPISKFMWEMESFVLNEAKQAAARIEQLEATIEEVIELMDEEPAKEILRKTVNYV